MYMEKESGRRRGKDTIGGEREHTVKILNEGACSKKAADINYRYAVNGLFDIKHGLYSLSPKYSLLLGRGLYGLSHMN